MSATAIRQDRFLSPEQRAFWEENGYVIIPNAVPQENVTAVIDAMPYCPGCGLEWAEGIILRLDKAVVKTLVFPRLAQRLKSLLPVIPVEWT